ncbi:Calcineurin-like phosphoesterase family protein [Tenacibaculum sp. 190524A05c]|uniref:metallophosphoesterase family protein n=1 Tax=Tenacibaculum platacis TaxID=3137852 RepID=UPI0031FA8CB2
MKTNHFILLFVLTLYIACNSSKKQKEKSNKESKELVSITKDSVSFSFVFLGCNRVDRHQEYDTTATNASTANLYVMRRIWNEVAALNKKPDLFFFLGDMVLGESTTEKLDSQLKAWVDLYKDTNFSSISTSGIETVAVPGNHEMLYYHDYGVKHHDEWPLEGATELWMKHMTQFMPKDRDVVTGKDSINNQMTFAFTRKNIGFILMNTDTYNTPTSQNPHGLEGQIPTEWIINKVEEYRNNDAIDHIFVLGHKPYYIFDKGKITGETGHKGLPEGPVLWPKLRDNDVIAMLSAHKHDYQRMQPEGNKTYQVIAGNAGSPGEAAFFGYTKIDVMSSGEIKLTAMGFDKGNPYYASVPNNPTTLRDQTILTLSKNANPYSN